MRTDAPIVVGITAYTPPGSATNNYSLPREYIDQLRAAGLQPVLLVGGQAQACLARLDGLVLAGGGDLDPAAYGGSPHDSNYFVDRERDGFEIALASECLAGGLPLLAICRGMQILNVALAGTLVPHLPERYGEAVVHRLPPREPVAHQVEVDQGSLLAEIVGAGQMGVMSWHHQAVDRLGAGLLGVAHAADGVVEAVEHEGAPGWVLGVQWHPELDAAVNEKQQAIFGAFARASAAYAAADSDEERRQGR